MPTMFSWFSTKAPPVDIEKRDDDVNQKESEIGCGNDGLTTEGNAIPTSYSNAESATDVQESSSDNIMHGSVETNDEQEIPPPKKVGEYLPQGRMQIDNSIVATHKGQDATQSVDGTMTKDSSKSTEAVNSKNTFSSEGNCDNTPPLGMKLESLHAVQNRNSPSNIGYVDKEDFLVSLDLMLSDSLVSSQKEPVISDTHLQIAASEAKTPSNLAKESLAHILVSGPIEERDCSYPPGVVRSYQNENQKISTSNDDHGFRNETLSTENATITEEISNRSDLHSIDRQNQEKAQRTEHRTYDFSSMRRLSKQDETSVESPSESEKPSLSVGPVSPLTSKKTTKLSNERLSEVTSWTVDKESSLFLDNEQHDLDFESLESKRESMAAVHPNDESIQSLDWDNQAHLKSPDGEHEKSGNTRIPEISSNNGTLWSFIGVKMVKGGEDSKPNTISHADSETVVTNNRSSDNFDVNDVSATMPGKSSTCMVHSALAVEHPHVTSRKFERVDESGMLGIGEDGEVIGPDKDGDSSSIAYDFLVDDRILAKTLFIYESMTEEDGILLESFRRVENGPVESNKTTCQVVMENSSITQLKKIRSSPGRETSHESQALFDILDRDFATVSARVTVSIGGHGDMRRAMTAEDVKLCFVAFVNCFTPPSKSHFAQEYNYDVDSGHDSTAQDDYGSSFRSHESESSRNEHTSPDQFSRPFVPAHVVNALWKDVIKCRFLDDNNINKGFAKKIESAPDEAFSSALSFLRDTLVLLGVLDVRKVAVSARHASNEALIRSTSDVFHFSTTGVERREDLEEVISVHQDIHQEYGEYMISMGHPDALHQLVAKYEKRWNSVISDACIPNSGNRNEASYAVQILPWTTIRANRFQEGAALLADKKFIHGRLQALGILEGTTAQVTDAEELIMKFFENKKDLLAFVVFNPDNCMVDAYEKTKKAILRQVSEAEEMGQGSYDMQGDTVHARQLRKLRREAGMALHLMGVSIGNQGFVADELTYCLEALNLKRASVVLGDNSSVTVSDTLHCIGYSLDNSGKYLQAMEYYDEALAIRKSMLGDDDLRVAETLHNKGAILCENGASGDALSCLEEALRIRTLHYGANHESCADTQQWIGNVMRECGDFDQALLFFKNALQVKKFTLGADHEEVANTLQNMSVVLNDMEKYSVSLDCYEEALRIYTLQFGNDDERVADTLHRMAIDYAITEQNELALVHFEKAIQIREKLLINDKWPSGKDKVVQSLIFKPEIDADIVETRIGSLIDCYEECIILAKVLQESDVKSIGKIQHRLGDLYCDMYDWDNAVEQFQGALRVQRSLADSGALDEVEVCEILHKKGVVHLYMNEHQKAKSCFESVIYRLRSSKENDVASEATSLYCLGVAFNHLHAHKLSLVSLTEALRIWTEIYGECHVFCGYALYWIGRQETQLLQFEKALTWYRAALKTFKSNKDDVDYAAVAKTLELLGGIHEQMADLDAALKCYGEGVRLVRWKFGDKHSFAIDMLCRSGLISEKQGCTVEAIEYFEDAISVMKACNREGDTQLCMAMEKLGLLQETEGSIDSSKNTLSDAYRLWEAAVGHDDLRTAVAVWKLGRVLDKQGSKEAAMQCYRECLRVQKLNLPSGDHNIADTLSSMGTNLSESEEYEEAIKCFQQALSIQRNAYGDNSLIVASTLHSLAKGYQEVGSFDKSVVCFKEALRISKSAGEENIKEISEISFGIALSHEANNNYQAAITHFTEALRTWKATSADDSRIPIALQKLGNVYSKAGDNSQAIVSYTNALDILGEQDGTDKKLMAMVLSGLARSYFLTGSHDCAIEMYQRHIDLLQSDSENRESVAESLCAMGSIYARLGNHDDATLHFKDCLLVRTKCFGRDDERVGKVLMNMGNVYDKSEDLNAARDCYLEALRINKMNANDWETVVCLKELGKILTREKDQNGALEHNLEALQLTKKLLGPGDPQVADLLYTCAATMYERHEYSRALEFFEDSLRIRRVKLGPTCVEIGETLLMIGQTMARSDHYDEALVFLKDSRSVLSEAKGNESLDVGNCNHSIGAAYVAKNDFETAIPYFLDALPLRQKYFGDDMQVASTLFELANAYNKIGNLVSALEYAVMALRIRKLRCGNQSLECAESLSQLGDIHLELLKDCEAQNCYNEALKVYTSVRGKGHVSVAECLEKIGNIYLKQDQLSSATDNLRSALKVFTENYGEVSFPVAKVLLTIGRVEAKKGASENAIACFKQSLSISNELSEKSAVAAALYEIGVVLESCGKKDEAMECYKETLRLAAHHDAAQTRAQTFNRIGGILVGLNDFDAALKAFDTALLIYKKLKGGECVEVGQTIHNIAEVYDLQSDYEKAQEFFKEAHCIFVNKLGPNDLIVALALNSLGINHARRKLFEQAVELCSEALRVRKDKLGTNHLDTCDAFYNIATILDEWGKEEEAMIYFTDALEAYRLTLGDNHLEVANCFKCIGILHLKHGEVDLATRAFVEALRIYQLDEAVNIGVADVLFNLGKIYTKLEQYEKALETLAQCLKIRKSEHKEEQLDIALTCLHIGIVYAAKDLPNEAKKFFERARSIYDDEGRNDTIEGAQVMVNLAKILSVEESYDKALLLFHKATEIFRRDIGEDTDEVAEVLVNIGIIHNKRVDYDEALKFLTSGLKIRTQQLGRDDMKVANTLFEIGQVMEDWGDSDEAIDTYAEVIRISKLNCGNGNNLMVESLKRMGAIYLERLHSDAALQSFLEAAEVEKRLHGENAVEVGRILLSIAGVHDARADEDSALAAYSDAFRVLKSNLGNDDLSVALALNNIGINHARRKNYAKSISLISEALRIRKLILGEDHLDVADSCVNIAHVLDEWGKDEQALKFYCEALVLYKAHLGNDDDEVANCCQEIGGIYMKQNDLNRAMKCYVESIRIFRQNKGMDNLDVALGLFNLGRVYSKVMDYDKAVACFKECLRIREAQMGKSHLDVLAVHRYIDAIERKRRK